MNNTTKSLFLTSLLAVSPLALGDTILGIYAGGSVWQSDLSGDVGDAGLPGADLEDLALDDEDGNVYFVALEHPVPLIPNIRLQHTDLSLSETAETSQTFVLDGVPYVAGREVASDFDLTHTDATLYYELLDNWVNLDVGATFRKFDGEVTFQDVDAGITATEELDETVPMLYGKAQFDLPFTGFYVAAGGNYTAYDGSDITDLQASLGYMSDGLLLDIGMEVGLRSFSVELDDVSDLDADMEIDGPFASVYLHF